MNCENENLKLIFTLIQLSEMHGAGRVNLYSHINHLCCKTSKKLSALARITPYMTLEKKNCHDVVF